MVDGVWDRTFNSSEHAMFYNTELQVLFYTRWMFSNDSSNIDGSSSEELD